MSVKILEEYFACPICIEILNCPITTVCGHNYCKSCINFSITSCPICKKEVNFSQLNINFQLKNIIESLKNLNYQELKTKFFPEIKEEDNRKELELKILVKNIFGINFLCDYCQCKEIIRNLALRILSNDQLYLNNLINYVISKFSFYKENNKLHSNIGFIKGNNQLSNCLSLNNPFKTIKKESKNRNSRIDNNKENQPINSEKMEFEVLTDKYFNNSNRGKKLFFNVKGNSENVFRVKRNRCELMEKVNKNSAEKFFDNNNLIRNNNNLISNNSVNNNEARYNFLNMNIEQNKINCHDNTTRKIQFDSIEVDRNLNNILKNFSDKNMFIYNEYDPVRLNGVKLQDSDTNSMFSSLISHALNENTHNPNNTNLIQLQNSNHNYQNSDNSLNVNFENLVQENNTAEYPSKKRKV